MTKEETPPIPEVELERIEREASEFSKLHTGLADPYGDREYGYRKGAKAEYLRSASRIAEHEANLKTLEQHLDAYRQTASKQLNQSRDRIQELEKQLADGGWISVDDKPLLLPDEGDTWEITDAGTKPFIAHIEIIKAGKNEHFIAWCYIPEGTVDLYYVGDEEPTGWMAPDVTSYIPKPLPEPPKG